MVERETGKEVGQMTLTDHLLREHRRGIESPTMLSPVDSPYDQSRSTHRLLRGVGFGYMGGSLIADNNIVILAITSEGGGGQCCPLTRGLN